jgi:hypothetical protein
MGIRLKIEFQSGEGSERRISLNVRSPITVAPMPIDIASGLLVYKESPEQLRQWAGFVLGASEIIDLQPLENWPEGDEILSALWDASFEGRLTEEAVRVATALTES